MSGQFDRQEIDFAITVPEMAPQNAQTMELFEDRYVCAVSLPIQLPNGHIARRVLRTRPCSCHAVEWRVLSVRRMMRLQNWAVGDSVSVSVPNFLSLPGILADSEFITVAPERILRPFAGSLRIFPTPLPLPPFKVIGAWHELSARSPAHTWLREKMAELSSRMDDQPLKDVTL